MLLKSDMIESSAFDCENSPSCLFPSSWQARGREGREIGLASMSELVFFNENLKAGVCEKV